ncbi:MAG: hypothetical protein WAV54_05615 [Acidimicrobiales bacterium]
MPGRDWLIPGRELGVLEREPGPPGGSGRRAPGGGGIGRPVIDRGPGGGGIGLPDGLTGRGEAALRSASGAGGAAVGAEEVATVPSCAAATAAVAAEAGAATAVAPEAGAATAVAPEAGEPPGRCPPGAVPGLTGEGAATDLDVLTGGETGGRGAAVRSGSRISLADLLTTRR